MAALFVFTAIVTIMANTCSSKEARKEEVKNESFFLVLLSICMMWYLDTTAVVRSIFVFALTLPVPYITSVFGKSFFIGALLFYCIASYGLVHTLNIVCVFVVTLTVSSQ